MARAAIRARRAGDGNGEWSLMILESKNKAFTLVELTMVVVIMGIIAGFVLPNFQKSVVRGQVRQVRNNLMAIQAGQEMYMARTGSYFGAAANLAAINTGLGLNLISAASDITYSCLAGYSCSAVKTGSWGFTMTVTQAVGTPTCTPTGAQDPC